MFFSKLYILRGVFESHDFANDLKEYMVEDGIPASMIDIRTQRDLHQAIASMKDENDIALHLDIHGDENCIQFSDGNCEFWGDVVSLLNILNSHNLKIMTMNVCKAASILNYQGSNGYPYFENLIASYCQVNTSEGCSRCHSFYTDLYRNGNIQHAWDEFKNTNVIKDSAFHLYINGNKN